MGKANDLRSRVKSYFYGDERKKIVNLLDEVRSVEGIRWWGELEALVVEARLIRRHEPKYNRRGKTWRRGAYLALDPREAWPRLKVAHAASPGDGRVYLGRSAAPPGHAREGSLEETAPIRRCTTSMGRARFRPCALATWAAASRPATAAPTPSATESSSDGSPPPWPPARASSSKRSNVA